MYQPLPPLTVDRRGVVISAEPLCAQVNESDCHYLVDLDFEGQSEPHYAAQTERWEVIFAHPFINSAASHPFFRAFYVPAPLSAGKTHWDRYVLLRSKTHFGRAS